MLNRKHIRERLQQAPFKPFRICLSGGRQVLIKHPDYVAMGGSVIHVLDEEGNTHRIDALHVVSLADQRLKRKNGKH